MFSLAKFVFPNNFHLTKTYLELGIGSCSTFNRMAPLFMVSLAVDKMESNLGHITPSDKVRGFGLTTSQFLTGEGRQYEYDFVFIDANHDANFVLADFNLVFPLVSGGGYIVIHDTYPPGGTHMGIEACHNAWKEAEYLSNFKGVSGHPYEIITLSGHLGLTLVRKRSRHLTWDIHNDFMLPNPPHIT